MRHFAIAFASLLFFLSAEAHSAVLYRISGLTNMTLPSWNIGDGDVSASMDICVHTSVLGAYAVTATGAGGYVLSNGGDQIAYTLSWEDSGAGNLGSTTGTALSNAVTLTNRQNPNSSVLSTDCSTGSPSGPTARLYLSISDAEMTAATAGSYSGTLTLTISAI